MRRNSASDARIDFQRRIEDKYREQLVQLLTPLVGAGNFTAEVQADVDLDESQATRESYDKEGVLAAEQGAWTGNKDGNAPRRHPRRAVEHAAAGQRDHCAQCAARPRHRARARHHGRRRQPGDAAKAERQLHPHL
jgi:hypothetical protein